MSNNGKSALRPFFKGLTMLALLGATVWLMRSLGLSEMLKDAAWFNEHVLGSGPLSIVIFLIVATLATALGLPRQVISFLGGMAFGVGFGTLLATVGTGLGCLACTAYARFTGRDFVVRTFGSKLEKMDQLLTVSPFQMALTIRLLPVGSNLLTNLAAGISSIPIWPFVIGSTVGYIPQNLVFALFGGGMNAESTQGVALSVAMSVALFVVSAWLGISVYRKYKLAKKQLSEEDC